METQSERTLPQKHESDNALVVVCRAQQVQVSSLGFVGEVRQPLAYLFLDFSSCWAVRPISSNRHTYRPGMWVGLVRSALKDDVTSPTNCQPTNFSIGGQLKVDLARCEAHERGSPLSSCPGEGVVRF